MLSRNYSIALIMSPSPKGKQKVFLTQMKTKLQEYSVSPGSENYNFWKLSLMLTLSKTLEVDSFLPGYYSMFFCLSKENSH